MIDGVIQKKKMWELEQNYGHGWELVDLPGTFVTPLVNLSIGKLTLQSVDDRWKGLRNALAGLFCASLGSPDEQRTTSPTRSYFPQGVLHNWNGTATHELRHATLPSEHVCTENLTPFLKLLPCKSLSGIAGLLNPHRLFDADWHGMGIHVLWLGEAGIKVRLTFQSVVDPLRISGSSSRGT